MPPEKISRSFALNLRALMDGGSVNASAFRNKKLLKQLVDDRAVSCLASGRSRAVYRCSDPDRLENYLRLHFGITDLDRYLALMCQEELDGEDSLMATASTKVLRTRGMQGFFIKSFGGDVQISGSLLPSSPEGIEYFVSDYTKLVLPEQFTVVGVENPECFQKADRLLSHFPPRPLLFVLRFYSNRLLDWLESIENPYLHFGDFDPAGISIYCHEFLARLGAERCRFFVPSTVERLLDQGQTALFDRQQQGWPPRCELAQPELVGLIKLINQKGKGAEQELLLASETLF
jgi:hypothetical protein